jgi:hypothetical protein
MNVARLDPGNRPVIARTSKDETHDGHRAFYGYASLFSRLRLTVHGLAVVGSVREYLRRSNERELTGPQDRPRGIPSPRCVLVDSYR